MLDYLRTSARKREKTKRNGSEILPMLLSLTIIALSPAYAPAQEAPEHFLVSKIFDRFYEGGEHVCLLGRRLEQYRQVAYPIPKDFVDFFIVPTPLAKRLGTDCPSALRSEECREDCILMIVDSTTLPSTICKGELNLTFVREYSAQVHGLPIVHFVALYSGREDRAYYAAFQVVRTGDCAYVINDVRVIE